MKLIAVTTEAVIIDSKILSPEAGCLFLRRTGIMVCHNIGNSIHVAKKNLAGEQPPSLSMVLVVLSISLE